MGRKGRRDPDALCSPQLDEPKGQDTVASTCDFWDLPLKHKLTASNCVVQAAACEMKGHFSRA